VPQQIAIGNTLYSTWEWYRSESVAGCESFHGLENRGVTLRWRTVKVDELLKTRMPRVLPALDTSITT
jgi:hypothetical protein